MTDKTDKLNEKEQKIKFVFLEPKILKKLVFFGISGIKDLKIFVLLRLVHDIPHLPSFNNLEIIVNDKLKWRYLNESLV